MNYRVVLNVLGTVIKFLGVSLLAPFLVALYYHEPDSIRIFAISSIVAFLTGLLLENINRQAIEELSHRESIVIVAFGWLMAALLGGIPFILAGLSPVDALFESMSGFTTTGSSILPDIEIYSKSILFWRSMTQWLGGMGIIVLVIAILPRIAVAGRQMFQSEASGPMKDKLKPRLKDTAQILWWVYIFFTILEISFLYFAGMTLYDAAVHTFTTLATGGFSPKNLSIAAYDSIRIELIILIFMFIGGANFSLFYRTLRVNRKALINNREFQIYALIILSSTSVIAFELWRWGETLTDSLRYASFQVVSIITTTGFVSTDFSMWPESVRFVLFILMFVGGSAGSTAGAMKVVRVVLLMKYGVREIYRSIHPRMVRPIRLGDTVIPDDIMQGVLSFFVLYLSVFVASSLVLSYLGLDLMSSISASATTIGNVGPALGSQLGPMENFGSIPVIGKLVLILNMWIGRLEIMTVLVLLVPSFWKK